MSKQYFKVYYLKRLEYYYRFDPFAGWIIVDDIIEATSFYDLNLAKKCKSFINNDEDFVKVKIISRKVK